MPRGWASGPPVLPGLFTARGWTAVGSSGQPSGSSRASTKPWTGVVRLFDEIAGYGLAVGNEALEQRERKLRSMAARHVRLSFSCGTSRHNATSACRVSLTARMPRAVTRKKRLARPPRSGVGAPIVDDTSPLRSRRSSAA